ncbi:MAG: zinc ribbon domain-containing protein [Deltaproteobacteria bacterium]|nr:MAG: zinc ribbon domain-containing protein [Deltaproteobacteria bacterium]
MSRILRFLEEEKKCPHCEQKMSCCEAPPIHIGDGLGWGAEVLFICLNDNCSVFLNGWKTIEKRYGHHASYRYMELPESKEKNYMMVGNADAFKASVINKEELLAQNERHQRQKEMKAALQTCVADQNIEPVLFLLLDEGAGKESRGKAADCIVPLNNLDCIDPLRNHNFKDPALQQKVNSSLAQLLKKNFKKECPHCMEIIKAQTVKCKHCREDV